MGIHKAISGYLEVELTSAGVEEAYSEVILRKVSLFRVSHLDALTVRFVVSKKDYQRIQTLCNQRGWGLRIVNKRGAYWRLRELSRRSVLVCAVLLCAVLTTFLSSVVLFVETEGNDVVSSRYILEAAGERGIIFGARRKTVRSEEIKNELLSIIPELKWVGVNTVGCRAIISVRERGLEKDAEQNGTGNIVAARAGIIDSVLVTKGTLLCRPGQVVQEGQILISGYTDCDFTVISTRAEGEIYANTVHTISAKMPEFWAQRGKIIRSEKRYSILIGKNRINLWKGSGICPTTCGKIYDEYYLTLPGNFRLPVALAVEQIIYLDSACIAIPAAQEMLSEYAASYLSSQMTAGSVLQKKESIISEDNFLLLQGEYLCREMIGAVQPERIGDNYGENN